MSKTLERIERARKEAAERAKELKNKADEVRETHPRQAALYDQASKNAEHSAKHPDQYLDALRTIRREMKR